MKMAMRMRLIMRHREVGVRRGRNSERMRRHTADGDKGPSNSVVLGSK